jgi:ADP-L-glycero-D-manno-heptose 6-epimerase
MKAGSRPRIFKFGEQKRDFIYVKDVARMTVGCLDLKQNTVLNIGTGIARSFNDIIAALNKSLKTDLGTEYFDNPYKGFYQDFTQADITQGKKLKLVAEYSLEDGIHDYVTNYLEKK